MSYTVSIGFCFNQPFQNGDVVPHHTAIYGKFCHTIISCVGKAPRQIKHDEPNAEIDYKFWIKLLSSTKGFKALASYIRENNKQIIYLSLPEVKEIIAQIKEEIPTISEDYRDRAEWLVFWSEESFKRYGKNAAIGLF
jgi:hypothetical protein